MLMDKYPVIVTIGAAVLGKVSAELIVTDAWVGGIMKEGVWHPGFISNALFAASRLPPGSSIRLTSSSSSRSSGSANTS